MHSSQMLIGVQAFPHTQSTSMQDLTWGRATLDISLAWPRPPSGAFSAQCSDIRLHTPDSTQLAHAASPCRAMPGLASASAPGQLASRAPPRHTPDRAEETQVLLKGSGGNTSLHSTGVFCKGLWGAQFPHRRGSRQLILAACWNSVRDSQQGPVSVTSHQGRGFPMISLMLPPQPL